MGLQPPALPNTSIIMRALSETLRKQNKAIHLDKQLQQPYQPNYWSEHWGNSMISTTRPRATSHHMAQMYPFGLALQHPAAPSLLQYATRGCPVQPGKPWTVEKMQAAINRGPHKSALVPDAIDQLQSKVKEKVAVGQAQIVKRSTIKDNPPPQLKISPISMIRHKS